MRIVVTGASGFLGWRAATLLRERGHDVTALVRPRGARRAHAHALVAEAVDAGDVRAREYLDGADAALHFAGIPDPARARDDPTRAVRENVGATLNLLEGCRGSCGLVYPSTVRAALTPLPDPYALSKRLGEDVCRLHPAPATAVRLTSVYGPGQVAREGATGAIAAFAAAALEGRAIVIPGDPGRARDFVFVDDVVDAIERFVEERRWNETVTLATGISTSLRDAAELVRRAAGADVAIETPGGDLPPGENESYVARTATVTAPTPVEEGISRYVEWLRERVAD